MKNLESTFFAGFYIRKQKKNWILPLLIRSVQKTYSIINLMSLVLR